MAIDKICIVRLSAIGDVILHLPLIRTLQKALPNCQITWITSRACYDLLEGISGVEFIVIDKPRSIADYWRFRQLMQNRSFDVLLATQASLRANLLYPFIKAPIKIGFDSSRSKDGQRFFITQSIKPAQQHLLESFLSFAETLGITDKVIQWGLAIDVADMAWARKQLSAKPLLAINPAASKAERSWSVDRYITVIKQAHQRWGVNVILTGGFSLAEREMAEQIIQGCNNDVPITNFVGKTNLKRLAALLAHADVLLAPDTGPAHLAVAMGTPVVGLYAVAPPELSAPYLYPDLVVNKFPEAVQQILGRAPDLISWGTRVHSPAAMQLIQPIEVITMLARVLDVLYQPKESVR